MSSKLRIYLILGVTFAMAIAAAILPWRAPGATPGGGAPSAQQAPRPIDRIHVERTLVRATEEVVERPVRTDRAPVRPRREAAAPPLMSRAKRVLFGSGRHRPEPFPRASLQEASAR
jgi:hypothetical protein